METASGASISGRKARTLAARIVEWHWKQPVLLACALLLTLLTLAYSIHSVGVGDQGALPAIGRLDPGFDSRLRFDSVLALVASYSFAAGLIGVAKATREFDRLRSIIRLDDSGFNAYRDRLFPSLRALLIAGCIGGAAGVAITLSPYLDPAFQRNYSVPHSLPFMILLFGTLGALALLTYRQSRVYHEIGAQHVEVDLLDQEALSPFAAVGLMNAGSWFIGSALASLLMVDTTTTSLVVMVIIVTSGFGFNGLIAPSRGLHSQIRTRKRAELSVVRSAIAAERAALLDSADRRKGPLEIHGLLSYEARIENIREWPFDTSTLGRFALFLLIPLVSWIGGALVERAINAALG